MYVKNPTPFDPTPYSERVEALLSRMTDEEKVGQLNLECSDDDKELSQYNLAENCAPDGISTKIRQGKVGGLLMRRAEKCRIAQKIAVEESRLGVPLLFGYDVIHGHRTIYPIPLAEASSFDLKLIEECESYAAMDAYSDGINWVYAPMIDLCRDPRWGRVAEGAGEDPLLGSMIAAARVRGFQRVNPITGKPYVGACFKHYCGYGLSMGGRDYEECEMSERTLFSDYMRPYQAAVEAGAMSAMSSFNSLNGEPVSGSRYYLTDVLRGKYGFKGFVVSDYDSVKELVYHRVVKDKREAARRGVVAGVDFDMASRVYADNLVELMQEDEAVRTAVDEAVRRLLSVKFALGLFEDPYNDIDRMENVTEKDFIEKSREMARRSMVLLKNANKTLPLDKKQKVFLTGPFAKTDYELIGTWALYSPGKVQSVNCAFLDADRDIVCMEGCSFDGDDESGFEDAIKASADCDVIVYFCGEPCGWSGECSNRMNIDLPEIQKKYLRELKKTGKKIVSVVLAGRAMCFVELDELSDAVLLAWHPGQEGANAIVELLYGEYSPSGRLPITFPRATGQIPTHHAYLATGRPREDGRFHRYVDGSVAPLYPFGYGLSYADISYSNPKLESSRLARGEDAVLHLTVTNSSEIGSFETVLVYFRDVVSTYSTADKKLCGFEKVFVPANSSVDVTVEIPQERLTMMTPDLVEVVEPGEFMLFVGNDTLTFMVEE